MYHLQEDLARVHVATRLEEAKRFRSAHAQQLHARARDPRPAVGWRVTHSGRKPVSAPATS